MEWRWTTHRESGAILGHKGEHVTFIRSATQANIKLMEPDYVNGPRYIRVSGPLRAVTAAMTLMDKYVWVNNHTHDFVQYMMLYIVATMFIPDTGVQLYCEMKMKEKFDVTSIDPSARKVEFKPVAPASSSSDNGSKRKREGE